MEYLRKDFQPIWQPKKTDNTAMPQQWEMMESAGAPQLFRVKKNGLLGIFHEQEGLLVLGDWEDIGDYRDGLAMVFKTDKHGHKKWGLIDEHGRLVTPCQWYYEEKPVYRELHQCSNGTFVNGYALVRDDSAESEDCYRILARDGRLIGDRRWSYFEELFDDEKRPIRVFSRNDNTGRMISYFEEGWYDDDPSYTVDLLLSYVYEDAYYYLTYDGTVLTPCRAIPPEDPAELPRGWQELPAFSGDYMLLESGVYMNTAGQFCFSRPVDDRTIWWDEWYREKTGEICVRSGPYWGILDSNKKVLIPCQWDAITLYNNVWQVEKDGKYGLLFHDGRELLPCQMEELNYVNRPNHGGAILTKCNGLWGVVDSEGRQIVPCQWPGLSAVRNGYKVFQDGLCGFLDEEGNLRLPCQWEDLCVGNQGLIKVKNGCLWGLVDASYQQIVPCIWRQLDFAPAYWLSDLIRVRKGGKWGALDSSGNLVFPCQWEAFEFFDRSLFKVKQNGLYGVIDQDGNQLLPCQWEDIKVEPYFKKMFMVKQNGKWGTTDLSGNPKLPCRWYRLEINHSERFRQEVFVAWGDGGQQILDLQGNEL